MRRALTKLGLRTRAVRPRSGWLDGLDSVNNSDNGWVDGWMDSFMN